MIEKILVEKFFVEKIFDRFFSRFFRIYLYFKASHDFLSVIFGILGKFGIEIGEHFFIDNLLIEKNIDKKIENVRSNFFRPKSFRIFFDEKFFARNFLGHLFRSQISPRFQKSYLEHRAMILKRRKITNPFAK